MFRSSGPSDANPQCSAPKFLKAVFVSPTQIKDELDAVYGDSAPSFTTVKLWVTEFKRGRKSLGDDERSGRSNTATAVENIAKVHQMVLDDHRIKVRDITETMSMSKERVCHILNQHLSKRKLSARWVTRVLTLDQKRVRINISNAWLAQFRRNKSQFWCRLITINEALDTPLFAVNKNTVQTVDCKGKPAPKKAKTVFSAGKGMTTFFWDSHGFL
ncbi:histone-lysine N-methyltransferase SETMAR [Trichonephila clavipes]|nr:histone-lysine N-methyltransferase SETMAR [Trichonephila clavipes]